MNIQADDIVISGAHSNAEIRVLKVRNDGLVGPFRLAGGGWSKRLLVVRPEDVAQWHPQLPVEDDE